MSFQELSFQEVLDDLQCRFIINVPEEELSSVERICFQIEQAHWFYEDFVREENPRLPTFSLKNFCAQFFRHCPLLHRWAHDHETAFQNFMQYKVRVPVCGAIILNENLDKVLLVKGWKSSAGWGFPKGKINKDEPEAPCAIREVKEETGFDITPYLHEHEYVERTIKGQRIRLYILTGVPEDTKFVPQTRKEIGDIRWHRLNGLPGWNKDVTVVRANGERRHKYYMVTAFVNPLRQWMSKYRKAKRQGKARNGRHLSVVMGYHTATDSEGEGFISDAGFRSGAEASADLRLDSISEIQNEFQQHDLVAETADSLQIDPVAAAQSIKALIGIGAAMETPVVEARMHVHSHMPLQRAPPVMIGASVKSIPGRVEIKAAAIPTLMQQDPSAPATHIHAIKAELPASDVVPQIYTGPANYHAQVSAHNRTSSMQSPQASHLPIAVPPPRIPVPPPARPSTTANREAHKSTLLEILTKGSSSTHSGATIPIPINMGHSLTPPIHSPRAPTVHQLQPMSVTGGSTDRSPVQVPDLQPQTLNPALHVKTAAPSMGLNAKAAPDKQRMLLDILMGDKSAGSSLSTAANSSTAKSSLSSGNVDTEVTAEKAEDQLKMLLGIGGLSINAGPSTHNIKTVPTNVPLVHAPNSATPTGEPRDAAQVTNTLKALLGLGPGTSTEASRRPSISANPGTSQNNMPAPVMVPYQIASREQQQLSVPPLLEDNRRTRSDTTLLGDSAPSILMRTLSAPGVETGMSADGTRDGYVVRTVSQTAYPVPNAARSVGTYEQAKA